MADAASKAELAARALALVDLTNLNDGCTAADIDALCARAVTEHGHVAAVCVYPAFVAQAKAKLAGTPVKVATVVNFLQEVWTPAPWWKRQPGPLPMGRTRSTS